MAAIDFPASPTLNQVFASTNGVNYQWNGTMWLAVGATTPTTPGGDVQAKSPGTFVVNPTAAVAVFSTVQVGNSGGWLNTSTGRYTPPAGRYRIYGMIWGTWVSSLCSPVISLRKNGVDQGGASSSSSAANLNVQASVDMVVDANGTDYFEIMVGSTPAANYSGYFTAFPLSGIQGPPGPPGSVPTGDFCVVQTSGWVGITSTWTTMMLGQVLTGNSGGWYSTSTGRYTPPAGRYYIECGFSGQCTVASQLAVAIRKNGAVISSNWEVCTTNGAYVAPRCAYIVDANGTDWFDMQGLSGAGPSVSFIEQTFLAYPISGIKGPPGDPGPDSSLLQTVSYQTGAVATGTTVSPVDDTIPQQTEGTQVMTLAITPKSATSSLIIEVTVVVCHTAASTLTVALFQDATASAIAAVMPAQYVADNPTVVSFKHKMTSGTTSTTTFKVRAGSGSAGTLTFNGASSSRFLGGVMASSIVIQEVAP